MFNIFSKNKNSNYIIAKNTKIDTKEKKYPNAFVVGTINSDKTNSFIVPNINRALCSYVIADHNDEIYNSTQQVLLANNYKIIKIDLNNDSIYNPLLYTIDEFDINIISNLLIKGDKSDDSYYSDMGELIFRIIILYITKNFPEEKHNLYNCIELLKNTSLESMQQILEKLKDTEIYSNYNSIIKLSPDTYESILEFIQGKLDLLSDLNKFSSTKKIDFTEISEKKTAIYINISDNEQINSLVFTQIIQQVKNLYTQNDDFEIATTFILDNFENLGKIFNINLFTKPISIYFIFDDIEKLYSIYGDNLLSILNSCDLGIYLGSNNRKTIPYILKNLNSNVMTKSFVNLDVYTNIEVELKPVISETEKSNKNEESEKSFKENIKLLNELKIQLETETEPIKIESLNTGIETLNFLINLNLKHLPKEKQIEYTNEQKAKEKSKVLEKYTLILEDLKNQLKNETNSEKIKSLENSISALEKTINLLSKNK